MGDPGKPTTPQANDRLQASHDSRRRFQNMAYAAGLGIVVAACLILLAGIAMPPPPRCLPGALHCVQVADWGASIVSRSKDASAVFEGLLGLLGLWIAGTLGRGAFDAKTGQKP